MRAMSFGINADAKTTLSTIEEHPLSIVEEDN